nr:putative DNA binding domain-containing protein [Bacteroidales bacterium]
MKLSAKYIDLSETQNVEFKSVWKDDFLKQICGFANTKGGRLWLGVDDKGHVIGLSKVPKLLEDIPNKMIQYLGITADIESHIADGFQYVQINIEASSVPISYKGKFYMRSGSTTQELAGHELRAFILKKDNITWDEIYLPDVDLGNIDKPLLLQFTKEAIGQNRLFNLADGQQVRDVLQNLNLSRAAVLLFGINPQKYIRTATVKLGRFGTSDSDLISQDVIQGNLLQMPDQIMELLRLKYLTSTISYEGLTRVETLEYPEKALREIILNAIVHRDYGEQTDITIKIFEDRIVFWNSGLLLAPLN